MNDFPLLIEFVPGTNLYREPETVPQLSIVQNGPSGTFVIFADGRKVPPPTDQIVFREWQSFHHFTVGGPVEDVRLTTLPAYAWEPGR